MHIVTVMNQKGGSAKTSSCFHLSGAFAAMGMRVLLVDNDPQSSLTQGFFGAVEARRIHPSRSIASIYAGDLPFPENVIAETPIPRISIMPGSQAAMVVNKPEPWLTDVSLQTSLRDFLHDLDYDIVLIDCPPNLHLCSWAAMVASQHIIVPAQPEDFGAQGIVDVESSWKEVQKVINPSLRPTGILLSKVGVSKIIHKAYEITLRREFGELVFEAKVPDSVQYVEAITKMKPIEQYRPNDKPAAAVRDVAAEILDRIASPRQQEAA